MKVLNLVIFFLILNMSAAMTVNMGILPSQYNMSGQPSTQNNYYRGTERIDPTTGEIICPSGEQSLACTAERLANETTVSNTGIAFVDAAVDGLATVLTSLNLFKNLVVNGVLVPGKTIETLLPSSADLGGQNESDFVVARTKLKTFSVMYTALMWVFYILAIIQIMRGISTKQMD